MPLAVEEEAAEMEEEAPFGARRGFLVGVFCSVGRSVSGRLRLVVGGGEVSSEVGEEGIMAFAEAERVLYVLLREDMAGGEGEQRCGWETEGAWWESGDDGNCPRRLLYSINRVALALFAS